MQKDAANLQGKFEFNVPGGEKVVIRVIDGFSICSLRFRRVVHGCNVFRIGLRLQPDRFRSQHRSAEAFVIARRGRGGEGTRPGL